MDYITRYIFGSDDSLDKDVCYLVLKLPNFRQCQKFCSEDKNENRNIAQYDTVTKTITETFKGLPDEVNNSIIHTYNLHCQEYPLILKAVYRHKMLKVIRCIRVILTFLTRTTLRKEIKYALLSYSLKTRLNILKQVDLTKIVSYNKKGISDLDITKKIAFRIGQTLLLLDDIEVYTKKEIVLNFPELYEYIYRQSHEKLELQSMLQLLISKIEQLDYHEDKHKIYFDNHIYDIKKERCIG